ncbi:MAG: hypothetical protein JWL59_3247 [Chthoniobacteraceae bacterium]|nr:hypothetical protein [Chthoniobacteraceae bacterium]
MRLFLPLIAALVSTASLQAVTPPPREQPGQRADGAVLLPNQWVLKPVGKQIVVGDFPVNIAVHPEGRFAAVLHCGYSQHEIVILDLKTNKIASRTAVVEAFYGLGFSLKGEQLYCSGSAGEVLHQFTFKNGALGDHEELRLRDVKERGVPAGFSFNAAHDTFYVANLWGQSITRLRVNPDGSLTPVDLLLDDKAPIDAPERSAGTDDPSITKRADVLLEKTSSTAPFPYTSILDETRDRLYVTLWAQAAVAVIDTKEFRLLHRWPVEGHPNEMLLSKDGAHLFVANANGNSVSIVDTTDGRIAETLVAELQPGAAPGNTPNSLALSPNEERLFVANANINTIAVFDVETIGHSRSLGFIPVGWYPTSVRLTPDGKKLLAANGKGLISKPNRNGPIPGRAGVAGITEYIGDLFQGTVSVIDLPEGDKFEKQLAAWSALAFQCVPETARKIAASRLEGNPIPRALGEPSPIKYVFYIIKENRTYDQVLGDMKQGNGDPSICLFPEAITPNLHALARDYVLLDNFYVESEVSADGHEWTMGAYATDFVEKTWPLNYGHDKKFPYPSEGAFPIATPAGGYLWDRAKAAGVTYRSYGEWVRNGKTPSDPGTVITPALVDHFDPMFRSFDMAYSDVKRAERFISELHRLEAEGEMPRLQIVRMPGDHTSGASPGKPTPIAHVADNDLGVGQVVEAISKSKFWPQTAIFIVEDDAQNGADHVDAHRTTAYVISPYVKRGSVDSTLYSTSSMLRTMELILGLKPMSQFDSAAMPMFATFQATADLSPFTALPSTVNLEETNTRTAWGADLTATMNFATEDAADDLLLNEMIWRSIRGANSPMPAPRRAAFVFTNDDEEH